MDKASQIKEIKARLPISSVIGERVALKGRSPNFTGLCPFHKEKTPSFNVRDNAARFKCFGCGAGGDVFEFLMRVRGITFVEAVQELSLKAGIIALPKNDRARMAGNKIDALSAQKIACAYFVQELNASAVATNYLRNDRGLGEKMIKQAALGFGGASREKFAEYLKAKGISDEIALAAGLLKQGRYSLVPPFLNRITFPIRNNDGVIIGFGARSFLPTEHDAPKYVNTHSYEHYEKRRSFYGWFESKPAMQMGTTPVLVEGYFDAMALWALGTPALALCGTSLTADHVKVLRSMSTKLTLCFDRDTAGQNALAQALILLLRLNIEPSLLLLDEKDPGDYLTKKNLAGLKTKIADLVDPICYVIDQASVAAQESVSERVKQIDMLLPILASMSRPLIRRQYVAYFAKRLHEEPAILWTEIEKRISMDPSAKNVGTPKAVRAKVLAANDRLALEILLANPQLIGEMEKIAPLLSQDLQTLLSTVATLIASESETALEILIEKACLAHDTSMWPPILSIVRDRILSAEEAANTLIAFEKKLALQTQRASLKTKRLELERHVRKKDFASALVSLKEKSELLGAQKSAAKKLEAPVVNEPVKRRASAPKEHKINDVSVDGSFFDASEDWQ